MLQQPGEADLLEKVVGIYLDETPDLIIRLRDAVSAGDFEQLRRTAHALKSSSAHIGAISLSAIAREMEMRGRQKSIEGITQLLTLIEQYYADARQELESLIRRNAA